MKNGVLEFKDAPMFGKVMRDPEICKGVLERILGFEIERIEYLNTEQTFDPATDAKGVRLDVFAKGSGRVYDIEMQIAYRYDLGRRMRYYQSVIDQACLDQGENYLLLPESYIIFVCDFDPYGVGLPAYHLERRCEEDAAIQLGDDAHWLVLNASAWDKDEEQARSKLLRYVHTNHASDDGLIHRIEDAVDQTNADAVWRESAVGFMTVEHDHRAQMYGARREGLRLGMEEGLKQGLEQGRKEEAARYSTLIDALLDAGRVDDLKRAADDPTFRQSLLEEFHIV